VSDGPSLLDVQQLHIGSHAAQNIEQSGPCGIQSYVRDDEVRFAGNQRRDKKKSGRRKIARHK